MSPTFSEEDSQLIARLHVISNKSPKLIKSSTYPAPADPNVTVRSWKMNEFKYYDIPSPFPTLARGIFTVELGSESQGQKDESSKADEKKKKYRIVARGYDKFFNIGEVPWCTVLYSFSHFLRLVAKIHAVASSKGTHGSTVHLIFKIKRMHHLHCRSDSK